MNLSVLNIIHKMENTFKETKYNKCVFVSQTLIVMVSSDFIHFCDVLSHIRKKAT